MRVRKSIVIKLDDNHRVYVYRTKVLYKERKNGRLVTRFVGKCLSDILDSQVISSDIKKKLAKILEKSSNFFNRG